jgi:hypothetical protein
LPQFARAPQSRTNNNAESYEQEATTYSIRERAG